MPVMLAVMEIPGCLVALFLVSRLRRAGMDNEGDMPEETDHDSDAASEPDDDATEEDYETDSGYSHYGGHGTAVAIRPTRSAAAVVAEEAPKKGTTRLAPAFNWHLLHEVFLNPGLFLLFGGILIGFVSRLQGAR